MISEVVRAAAEPEGQISLSPKSELGAVQSCDSEAAQDATWRRELREAYTSVRQLVAAGYVDASEADSLGPIAARYRLRLPKSYARLMDLQNPRACPIRAQALPHAAECAPPWPAWAEAMSLAAFGRRVPWTADAIGDVAHLAAPRLTHRYTHRALMHITTACAVYCRFCFRKAHLNAGEAALYDGSLDPAFAYLAQAPEVREVILSGGDPLSMTDGYLARLIERLEALDHVRTLRIHSRMATTLPSRITPRLARLLGQSGLNVVVVSHFNHGRELSAEACAGLGRLRKAGVTLLNQAVLLAGVNDKPEVLASLLEQLYAQGVLPYYLHHADWTPDTFHFRVPIAQGRRIMAQLAGRVAGPAMPHYVVDTPGGGGKVNLMDGRVKCMRRRQDASLRGWLWSMPLPATRAAAGQTMRYADFCGRAPAPVPA